MKPNRLLELPRKHEKCCAVFSYKEGKCSIRLPSPTDRWVCISGTKYQENHKRIGKLGDLILFWELEDNLNKVYPIELKGGSARIDHVVEQLQQGANLADEMTKGESVELIPVLVHNGLGTFQMRALGQARISFRGKKRKIALLRCGSNLADAK